jgi:hypothetical protein
MNLKNVALASLLQWLILALLKAWFFNSQIFESAGLQQIVYWLLVIAVMAAIARRFGIINFLESFFLVFVWTLQNLLFDVLFLSPFTTMRIFYVPWYWWGYFAAIASILLFHKKRHIHVRHEMHAKNHPKVHHPPHGHEHKKH